VSANPLSLLDWRRRVAELYADVRAAPDPATGHATWRAGRDELFASHPDTPLLPAARAGFTGLPVAAYDPAYRFEASLDRSGEGEQLQLPTGTDGVVVMDRVGRVSLPGGLGRLDVWWLGSYGGGLFLPVRDGLAGRRTYGGGRYLLDTVKSADLGGDAAAGRLVLDFNFAYNPSCAYDPAWACPLAPPGNVLLAELPVGELYPG